MIDSSIIKAAKEHIALSSVIKLSSDVEAVETGFTKQISGRTPEQRGNGFLSINLGRCITKQGTVLARFVTERLNFCKRTIFGLVALQFLTLNGRTKLWF